MSDILSKILPNHENDLMLLKRYLEQSPFSSEYLLLVINSNIGQTQLLRNMTIADTVGHITNQNVSNLLIPCVSSQLHKKITGNIRTSHTAYAKSRQLLGQAKRSVELFIEEGEEVAVQFLEA